MSEQLYTKVSNGTVYYYKDPEQTILHRTDGPAIVWEDGDEEWYQNGELHRMDGPAVTYKLSNSTYYLVDDVDITSIRSGVYWGTTDLQQQLDKLKGTAV